MYMWVYLYTYVYFVQCMLKLAAIFLIKQNDDNASWCCSNNISTCSCYSSRYVKLGTVQSGPVLRSCHTLLALYSCYLLLHRHISNFPIVIVISLYRRLSRRGNRNRGANSSNDSKSSNRAPPPRPPPPPSTASLKYATNTTTSSESEEQATNGKTMATVSTVYRVLPRITWVVVELQLKYCQIALNIAFQHFLPFVSGDKTSLSGGNDCWVVVGADHFRLVWGEPWGIHVHLYMYSLL